MTDNNPDRNSFARTPLNVIALFLALVEAIAASSVIWSSGLTEGQRWTLVLFIAGFPILVLFSFLVLLIRFHRNLYAPFEYRSDDSFLRPQTPQEVRQKFLADVEEAEAEVAELADNDPTGQHSHELQPATKPNEMDELPTSRATVVQTPTKESNPSLLAQFAHSRIKQVRRTLVEADQAERYVIELIRSVTPYDVAQDAALHGDVKSMGFDAIVRYGKMFGCVEVITTNSQFVSRDRISSLLNRATRTADTAAGRKDGLRFGLLVVAVSLTAADDHPMLFCPADESLITSRSFSAATFAISMRKLRDLFSHGNFEDASVVRFRDALAKAFRYD